MIGFETIMVTLWCQDCSAIVTLSDSDSFLLRDDHSVVPETCSAMVTQRSRRVPGTVFVSGDRVVQFYCSPNILCQLACGIGRTSVSNCKVQWLFHTSGFWMYEGAAMSSRRAKSSGTLGMQEVRLSHHLAEPGIWEFGVQDA